MASTTPWNADRSDASLVSTLKTGVTAQATSAVITSSRSRIRARAGPTSLEHNAPSRHLEREEGPMTTIDPVWATVAELSRAFQARTLSPVDVVDALLARIRTRDGALHAFIAVYDAEARLAAEAADSA